MSEDRPAVAETQSAKQASPEHLEQAMVVIDLKAWIAIATLMVVLIATLVWAFFGTMPLRQEASGALVRSGHVINFFMPQDGTILDMSIAAGEHVERDQVIARIDQSALVEQINLMASEGADQGEIELLRKKLLDASHIISYEAGRVQDVYVRTGDYVPKGAKIATILESPDRGKNLECLLYVPIDKIHTVKKGMQVNVFPDFADKNTYGNLFGTVESISEYPVTENYLLDALGNEELAKSFLSGAACYEVKVSLMTSEDTKTGYRWTISKGPDVLLSDLSLVGASIVLSEKRPIDVFFFNK